jgi:hypothetical protein
MKGARVSRLIVTTNNQICVAEYSEQSRDWTLHRLWSRFAMFYGCDWDERYVYIAARDSPHFGGKNGETILRFDRSLRFVDVWYRSRQVLDMHQICTVAGSLWITNTYHNGVRIIDLENRIEKDYFPYHNGTTPGSFDPGDRNHFNTIRYDGKQVFMLASNNTVQPGLRKRKSKSRVLVVDPRTLRITADVAVRGMAGHDLWIEDGALRTCDSARGVICGPENAAYARVEPWLRGVAISDRIMFMGKSAQAARHQRAVGNGQILAIDRTTQTIVSRTEIAGSGGVYDMMLLDEPDLARFGKAPFCLER